MESLLKQESHFAFGKNWLDYAQKIDELKIAQAMADLQRLNNGERLDGKSFLDIGCGSGLHALAAIRLGAKSVSCVDIDPDSVQATKQTLDKFAPDVPAQVTVLSVFDMSPEKNGTYDVVYSWGVLHHTGNMYLAIENAAALVNENGVFMIALYTKTPFCGMWRFFKKRYSIASSNSQLLAQKLYKFLFNMALNIKGENLKSAEKKYNQKRGMDLNNDVHDWLGGYPYESILPVECNNYFQLLGFLPIYENLKAAKRSKYSTVFGSGCDEYTFSRID